MLAFASFERQNRSFRAPAFPQSMRHPASEATPATRANDIGFFTVIFTGHLFSPLPRHAATFYSILDKTVKHNGETSSFLRLDVVCPPYPPSIIVAGVSD
jgi:hypothetical protein